MADLTTRSIASSYKELLKTAAADGLTTTLTIVEDGDATASSLQLATNAARLTGTLQVDGITTLANVTESSDKDTGSLVVEGGVGVEKNLNVGGNLNVIGNAVIQGTLTANGGTLTLGDTETDNVVFNADVNSHILPNTDNTYDLGSAAKSWRNLHVDSTATINNVTITGSQTISATTQSTDKDTGALVIEGGLGVEKNTNIGGNLGVTGTTSLTGDTTITGDLAVNGGDLTTSAATFNLLNATATTVNFAGAGTLVEIGAATGTTNINNNLDVDGDLNIDGGDLTVSTTTFNLANTTATTLNIGGAATALEIGAATGTTNVNNNLDVDGDVN
ncbi:MAG: hypothetical protein EB101_13120, partial [Chitinophagia bacterium]|nr:hypothetical protein [Chitinophagia bacterium]